MGKKITQRTDSQGLHKLVKNISEPPPIQFFSDSEVYDGKQPRHSKKGSKIIPEEFTKFDSDKKILSSNFDESQTQFNIKNIISSPGNNNEDNTRRSNVLETFQTEPEQMPDAPSHKATNSCEYYSPLYAPPTALRKQPINTGEDLDIEETK